jgi:hypothetical protein
VRYSSKHPRQRTTADLDRQDGGFSRFMESLSWYRCGINSSGLDVNSLTLKEKCEVTAPHNMSSPND